MGWTVFTFWLLLTPIWIAYWYSAGSSEIMFVPPALVLLALAVYSLWRRLVTVVAGEAEPSARYIQVSKLAAAAEADRLAGINFHPNRTVHPLWGLALPSTDTVRIALIAAAVGAVTGAAAVWVRMPELGVSREGGARGMPVGLPTEAVKTNTLAGEPSTQGSSPTFGSSPTLNGSAPTERSELQDSTNGQGSSNQPPCDVALCERYYHSFRASDCTYQPYGGPRQLCTR
jgi:hypothetical protein